MLRWGDDLTVMTAIPRTEHAVARSLAETADPRDAVARALRAIGESLGWHWGAVWEPAPEQPDALCCVEVWEAAGTDAGALAALSRAVTLSSGIGLPGRVWASGEPAWIADVTADDNFPRVRAAHAAGLRAAFCFPIRSARGVLGVIELFSTERRGLDAELLATMAMIGDQIGQAVERRRDAEALRAKRGAPPGDARGGARLRRHAWTTRGASSTSTRPPSRPSATGPRRRSAARWRSDRPAASCASRHRRGLARYLATEAAVAARPRARDHRHAGGRDRRSRSSSTITRIDVPGPPTFTGYLRDITDRQGGGVRAAGVARADRGGGRRRAAAARARPPRRRAAAARRAGARTCAWRSAKLDDDPGRGRRAAGRRADGPRARRPTSCASWPAASTPRCSPRAGSGRRWQALVGALDACRCGSWPLPERRLPGSVEVAAYFVVAEALTNVARYARRAAGGGRGRALRGRAARGGARRRPRRRRPERAAPGCAGWRDRVAALDGRLRSTARPGGGTLLRAELPCAS